MMTRSKGRECKTMLVNIDNLVPQEHFLRELDATVSFEFIYPESVKLASAMPL